MLESHLCCLTNSDRPCGATISFRKISTTSRSDCIDRSVVKKKQSVAVAARPIFGSLTNQLEAEHLNRFVAIEPISSEFFVSDTKSEAIGDSRRTYPDRLIHTFRIGHAAAWCRASAGKGITRHQLSSSIFRCSFP